MSKNWLNLVIRVLLEITALYAIGIYFFTFGEGYSQYFLAIVVPTICAVCWSIFRYSNDPREPIFPINGKLRLIMEASFFGLAVYGLKHTIGLPWSSYFLYAILFHYFVSYDRVYRLWMNRP